MIKIINFLNRRDLQKLKSRADVSGWLLIIILSLDIHRFGAWYTGNQAHIRPYIFPFLCLAGIPIIIFVMAGAVQYCVRRQWFTLLYLSGIYVCALPFSIFNFDALKYIFKKPLWYNASIFEPIDLNFFKGVGLLMLTSAGITAGLCILGLFYKVINSLTEKMMIKK
ncbi:MAG: hypothetical protein CVV49_00670 [Spirochaetae bacterium HGW-Spirochaetae-5]|nr:MAG: hypothetical protein CVV49_00670 [Spirochaetae bacterium HGW-Spirochaetae-5]